MQSASQKCLQLGYLPSIKSNSSTHAKKKTTKKTTRHFGFFVFGFCFVVLGFFVWLVLILFVCLGGFCCFFF